MDPWSALIIAGLQLDFVLLTTAPWVWLFSWFLTHLAARPAHTQRFFSEGLTWNNVKGLTDVQEDNIHCSPLCPSGRSFVIEAYQVA